MEKTVPRTGGSTRFFNNAGIEGKVVPIQDYDEDMFDRVIAVNLKGVFLGMRHVLPVMLRQGSGGDRQYRLGRGVVRLAGHVGLCGFEAWRAGSDQGGIDGCGGPGGAGERGLSQGRWKPG